MEEFAANFINDKGSADLFKKMENKDEENVCDRCGYTECACPQKEIDDFLSSSLMNTMSLARKEVPMLNWAVTFFVIAIVAAVLGFTNIAGSALDIAKILFVVFLVLAIASFVFGRRVTP